MSEQRKRNLRRLGENSVGDKRQSICRAELVSGPVEEKTLKLIQGDTATVGDTRQSLCRAELCLTTFSEIFNFVKNVRFPAASYLL